MNAYVKTDNGAFPDVNFYSAWKGFRELGYAVALMDDERTADVCLDTPVFAGIPAFERVMQRLGANYQRLDTYPAELQPLLVRNLERMQLQEAKRRFSRTLTPVFVKPVMGKQFHGRLWRSSLDLIPLAKIPGDAEVFVSDPIVLLSEFRCYVKGGEIVAVKHHAGDWERPIGRTTVEDAVRMFKAAPAAYALDFGVAEVGGIRRDVLVEANDATSLGNYGLDAVRYAEMLVARWDEIVYKKRKEIETARRK